MIIIPARLASTRFPKKVLADIHGVPMAVATAKRVSSIDDVCIATDSDEVMSEACKYGVKCVMTKATHESGTDRIYEAATLLGLGENELIVNVQADEPFIEPQIVQGVFETLKTIHDPFKMASCYKIISHEEAQDPNMVKVVVDDHSRALYFSRSAIPFDRDNVGATYRGHLGIYGFSMASLREFCSWDVAWLEKVEKLEQLRAMAHGKSIVMNGVVTESFGIDTREDYERAMKLFS